MILGNCLVPNRPAPPSPVLPPGNNIQKGTGPTGAAEQAVSIKVYALRFHQLCFSPALLNLQRLQLQTLTQSKKLPLLISLPFASGVLQLQ